MGDFIKSKMKSILQINKKNVIILICCFFILLYPFNATITDLVYPNKLIMLLTIAISEFILFCMFFKRKIESRKACIFAVTFIICMFALTRNFYVIQSRLSRIILFLLYLFLPFIICLDKKIFFYFDKVIKLFCYEHVFFTYFIIIFKKFYTSVMIPIIAGKEIVTKKSLIYWAKTGYNAGLTAHYSTNAIYLSIASIYFFAKWISSKEKKDIIMFILSFIGLILTAKRAHLLIVVVSCFATWFMSARKDELKKKIKYAVIAGICAIICLIVLSMIMPSILNVVNRFKDGIINGTLLNGREKYYYTAISLWTNEPILGNGWGYFSEYYQDNIFDLMDPAYNLEYLDCHNVYLQVLAECGIVGFLIIFGIVFWIFDKAVQLINYHKNSKTLLPQLLFSAGFQLFFIIYCLCGNPLYDAQCYVVYFISVGITLTYWLLNNKKEDKIIEIK